MASLTIRNLEEAVKLGLRRSAAERGVSMEKGARAVLREAALRPVVPRDLGAAIAARFASLGGVAIDVPERGGDRPLPTFE